MKKSIFAILCCIMTSLMLAQTPVVVPAKTSTPQLSAEEQAIKSSGLSPTQYWHIISIQSQKQIVYAEARPLQEKKKEIQDKLNDLQKTIDGLEQSRQAVIAEAEKTHLGMKWDDKSGSLMPAPKVASKAVEKKPSTK